MESYDARDSMTMDFSELDRAPMHRLNGIIWKSVRGADSPVPAPRRRFTGLTGTVALTGLRSLERLAGEVMSMFKRQKMPFSAWWHI